MQVGGRPTCLVQIGRETHRVDAGRGRPPWLVQTGRETHMVGADMEGDQLILAAPFMCLPICGFK